MSPVITKEPLLLSGVPGSPYTRKMTALLRYRRIAYRLVPSGTGVPGLPKAKPHLLPTFYLPGPDGALQAVTDSTPLIHRFEAEHAGRHVLPTDPALAFVDALLEDFADEWLTKAMFHYRWTYAADVRKAKGILASWLGQPLDDVALQQYADMVADRQIPRLRYVGSNPVTQPVIEAGYLRVLTLLEDHFRTHRFLMGQRPGASDFGFYGQLTQLVQFDPTPMAVAVAHAPRVCGWVAVTEDLSGLEPTDGDWLASEALPETLRDLLAEMGQLYAPLLLANARALETGQTELQTHIKGAVWVQQTFTYQAKCLAWLRRDYAALPPQARATVDRILAGTGCETLFDDRP
jgi:glutathione S-transferase